MWSIIPFKVLTQGKQRLAGVLTERERAGLCCAMIEDLLTALQQVSLLEGILMVSDDAGAARLAKKYGLDLVKEDRSRGSGLNSAVNCATDRLMSANINDIMVIHGDLPLVSTTDLSNLIQHHRLLDKPALTLVPDRWGKGTNCLISSSCPTIPVCFGKDSLSKHRHSAELQGINIRLAEIPSIMFDVDTPADLRELLRRLDTLDRGLAVHTRTFLDIIDAGRCRETTSARIDRHYAIPKQGVLR